MQIYTLEQDIHLACVRASSFPDGIKEAHEKLITMVKQGNYYGVSYLYDDKILYMAGVDTILPDVEAFTLKKGNYISIFIPNFNTDISQIEKAFKQLLNDPRIDPNGCCTECYFPEGATILTARDVRCMVRLADKQ